MMAIQVLLGGCQVALVRGYDIMLAHLASAILGEHGDLAQGVESLRTRHEALAAAGIPCGLLHLLRLEADADGAQEVELVWHDLEAPPGRSGVVLRYRFSDGVDPAYALFRAMSVVAAGADVDDAAEGLRRCCAPCRTPVPGEDARVRLDRMRKVQQLVAPGPGNPLALVPSEIEIGGDHAGALEALPDRIAGRFEILAPALAGRRTATA